MFGKVLKISITNPPVIYTNDKGQRLLYLTLESREMTFPELDSLESLMKENGFNYNGCLGGEGKMSQRFASWDPNVVDRYLELFIQEAIEVVYKNQNVGNSNLPDSLPNFLDELKEAAIEKAQQRTRDPISAAWSNRHSEERATIDLNEADVHIFTERVPATRKLLKPNKEKKASIEI